MLYKKSVMGVFWSFVEQLSRRGVSFFTTIVLAYFLSPRDFGLLAMISIFIALAQSFSDSGIKLAIIQRKKIDEVTKSTSFIFNIVSGLFVYAAIFCVAPYIAEFYEEPKLIELIRVAALTIPVSSFQLVPSAIAIRNLNFKLITKSTLPAATISAAIAIFLAYENFGAMALVIQMVSQSVISTILINNFSKWRPKLSFSFNEFRQIYKFSYKMYLSSVLDITFTTGMSSIVAKFFGASAAGTYYFSERINQVIVNQLITSLQNVIFSSLSKLQDEGIRLKKAYRKLNILINATIVPLLAFIIASVNEVFLYIPEKWSSAQNFLVILLLASLFTPINSVNMNLIKSLGRSDIYLRFELIKKIFLLSLVVAALFLGEIIYIPVAILISSIISFFINASFSSSEIGYGAKSQLHDVFAFWVSSILIIVNGYFVDYMVESVLVRLAITFISSILIYLVFTRLFAYKFFSSSSKKIISYVRNKL